MRRQQNDPPFLFGDFDKPLIGEPALLVHGLLQGIYDRVSGYDNPCRSDTLAKKSLLCSLSRSEVKICNTTGKAAVDLFRKWICFILRTKACLNVPYRDTAVECSKASYEGCCRVALNEDQIRARVQQDTIQSTDRVSRKKSQRLSRPHDVEVVVWVDPKNIEDLIKHVAMLGRRDRDDSEVSPFLELEDDRRELDRVRTRAENHSNRFSSYAHDSVSPIRGRKTFVSEEGTE
jgi:hypothetical protein